MSNAEYHKKYWAEHKDHLMELQREWKRKNRIHLRELKKEWKIKKRKELEELQKRFKTIEENIKKEQEGPTPEQIFKIKEAENKKMLKEAAKQNKFYAYESYLKRENKRKKKYPEVKPYEPTKFLISKSF